MGTTTLTSKGQLTLPKEIREHLRLDTGDLLEFLIEGDGSVRLRPVGGSVRSLVGLLRRPGRTAPSLAAIEDGVAGLLAAEDERIRRGAG